MAVSNLTIALSAFSENDVRAIAVGKGNPTHYQVFYKADGKNRVMLVPRKNVDFVALQREVGILLSRDNATQMAHGFKDGN